MNEMIRVVFCGQKPLGEQCLNLLLNKYSDNLSIAGIVSNAGLSGWWQSRDIADKAADLKIPFMANDQKDDLGLQNFIAAIGAQILLSVQHPWILSRQLLSKLDGMAFNLHLAPLPNYRGWNGCSHAILNDDDTYGVTLHWIAEALDLGDSAYTSEFPVARDETAASLYSKSTEQGLLLFECLLKDLCAGRAPPREPMPSAGALYRRSDLEKFRRVELENDGEIMERRARAFYFPPYEPAFFLYNGRKVYLYPERSHGNEAREQSFYRRSPPTR